MSVADIAAELGEVHKRIICGASDRAGTGRLMVDCRPPTRTYFRNYGLVDGNGVLSQTGLAVRAYLLETKDG